VPTLTAYVDQKYAYRDQRESVKLALGKRSGGVADYLAVDRTQDQCDVLWAAVVKRHVRHPQFHFVGFDQLAVDTFGNCLQYVLDMLQRGQQHVGEFNTFTNTTYEDYFGTRVWHGRSATKRNSAQALSGFELRTRYVRNMFTGLVNSHAQTWVLVRSIVPGDVGSLSTPGHYQMSIGPAFPRGAPGYFHASVIIHEMGHNLGLADVCSVCQRAQLADSAHFVARVGLTCGDENATHGSNGPANGQGHFISKRRCLTLASDHKNMAVFNTDSYRWFCCAYFSNEVDAEVSAHKGLKAAEDAARAARRAAADARGPIRVAPRR